MRENKMSLTCQTCFRFELFKGKDKLVIKNIIYLFLHFAILSTAKSNKLPKDEHFLTICSLLDYVDEFVSSSEQI